MPDPTRKADAIEDLLTSITGKDRVSTVKDSLCVFCPPGEEDMNFRTELDRREYRISGICQKCQDKIFTDEEEE